MGLGLWEILETGHFLELGLGYLQVLSPLFLGLTLCITETSLLTNQDRPHVFKEAPAVLSLSLDVLCEIDHVLHCLHELREVRIPKEALIFDEVLDLVEIEVSQGLHLTGFEVSGVEFRVFGVFQGERLELGQVHPVYHVSEDEVTEGL